MTVILMPPRPLSPGRQRPQPDPLGSRRHQDWWHERRDSLAWQPISTYVKTIGPAACATPYVLRFGDDWTYGCWAEGEWHRWLEGGTCPLEDFSPTEWADVDLDDAILLGQE